MFGFKHTMNNLDHNDHKVQRSRLYGRLLQVNGPVQLVQLYPNINARLESVLNIQLRAGRRTDGRPLSPEPAISLIRNALGWTSIPLAATVRKVASQMMGVIFFGDNLCN